MTTDTQTLTAHVEIHAAGVADGAAPEWLHLVPAGEFRGADGRGPYVLADPEGVIARSMRAGKLCLDECHSTDLAAPDGRPAPARGWIVEMQARPDGIWGRVDWTPAGRQLMADRAYRGISPVIRAAKALPHAVVDVLRASLTNDPNLPLTTLHHREAAMSSLAPEILTRLGLAAGADDAAVAAAIGAALDQVDAHARTLAAVAAATAAPQGATGEALVTHLQSVAARAAGAGETGEMRTTIIELQGRLDREVATRARERAERVIDQAIVDGKPIKPLRDHYIARHAADPAAVERELAAMVSIHSGGIDPVGRRATATCVSDDPLVIQRAAEAHQAVHGGDYAEAVLVVTGRV